MANEAVMIYETDSPIQFGIHVDLAVEKGTLLTIIDPMSVSKHSSLNQPVAGIAAEEHIASTGKDKIAVFRRGIAKVTISGPTAIGRGLILSATANKVSMPGAGVENYYIGTALETAADGETLLIELSPFAISQ